MKVYADSMELYKLSEVTEPDQIQHTLAGYDAFIDPEGNFYGTKPSVLDYWNGSYNYHSDWAYEHLHAKQITYAASAKDHLVKNMGWISVSVDFIKRWSSGLELPNGKITTAQAETLYLMWAAAELDMDYLAEALKDKL